MADSDSKQEPAEAWSVGRLLTWTKAHFESRRIDEPRLSAELLLAKALGCGRINLYADYDRRPTPDERAEFRETVRAAADHKPIAYLIGHKEFYSLDFEVTPDVLIPRPETELLVERALAWCNEHARERYDLLDLGTGSGCVAITIAKRQPALHAIASDVSKPALAIASKNAQRHDVADRVRCIQADLLDLPEDGRPAEGFDLIVSNPPYIAEIERESLPRSVRDHEPQVALFIGKDGLDAYRRIAAGLLDHLRPGGTLILEVGHTQAEAVEQIMASVPGLQTDGRYKDLSGIDRVIQFILPT